MGHLDAGHALLRISWLLIIAGGIVMAVASVQDWALILRMTAEAPDPDQANGRALAATLAGTRRLPVDTLGLRRAEMAEQCRLRARHWQVSIEMTAQPGQLAVPSQLAYDLSQMLREAVSNAVRHACARTIAVLRARIDNDLVCMVENEATKPLAATGARPLPLDRRICGLGGKLQVMTVTDRVTVEIHLPLGEQR